MLIQQSRTLLFPPQHLVALAMSCLFLSVCVCYEVAPSLSFSLSFCTESSCGQCLHAVA